MAGLRRFLLVFWGLICTGVAVLLAAMLLNSSLAERVVSFLDRVFLYNMELVFLEETSIWMAILFGLLFLAFGLLFIIIALAPKSAPKQLRITTTDGGSVDISLSALQNVIKRAVSADESMSLGNINLHVKNDGLYVKLGLMIKESSSVPQIGNQVREEVKAQLESFAGIVPADITVNVSDIIEEKNPSAKKPASTTDSSKVSEEKSPDTEEVLKEDG